MHVEVNPLEMVAVLYGDDGETVDAVSLPGAGGFGDEEWKALSERAMGALAAHLLRMRACYEHHNLTQLGSTFHFRNLKNQQDQRNDIAVLGTWLLSGRAPGKQTRDRLRSRSKLLGIDLPSSI